MSAFFSLLMPASPKPNHNACIQGLRGAAAFAVVMYHLHYMSAKGGFTEASKDICFANVGPYAVLLFFCISGYLIADTLCRHGDLQRFAINRVARIYPLFFVLHLVMFSLGPWMNYEWMGQLRNDLAGYGLHFMSNLLLLPGMIDLPLAQKNAWSLSYEVAFYLLAGTIYAGGRRWGTGMGTVLWILGWIACVEACVLHAEFAFFAIGTLVWWLQRRGSLNWRGLGPLSLLAGAAGLFCLGSGSIWLSALLVLPFFADVARQSGWASAILRTRLMNWLGKISYSLYLVHPFILDPLRRVGHILADSWGNAQVHGAFVVLGVVLAVVAAAISHELIEVRLTRYLLRRPVTAPA
jgi:peptidoglycan/LPS O-acetylase OafA/YrhL